MAKAQPYAEKREPAPAPKPLTANAAADLRALLQQTEGERERVAAKRADMLRQVEQARSDYERFAEVMRQEVDSAETVLAELDGTADRYRQRLGTAVEADKLVHAAAWASSEVPQTGSFAAPEGPVCPCGHTMIRDERHGWIHPFPDGSGFHAAGENCQRAKAGQTQALPEVVTS